MLLFLVGCSNQSGELKPKSQFKGPVYDNQIGPLAGLLNEAQLPAVEQLEFENIGIVSMVVEGDPKNGEFSNGQCTGFLISANGFDSDQLVVTNAHCITDVVKNNKDSCEDFLGIRFPESQRFKPETRMCKKLLYTSPEQDENMLVIGEDLAVFSIEPTQRKGFEISTLGVQDGNEVQVFKIDPIAPKKLGGSFGKSNCKVTMNSTLLPESESENYVAVLGTSLLSEEVKHNSSIETSDCFIVNGNSGSPVLNNKGEVLGVAQSYYSNRFLELIESIELGVQLLAGDYIQYRFPETVPKHIHFSQLRCLNISSDEIERGDCEFFQESELTTEEVLNDLRAEAKEEITNDYLLRDLGGRLLEKNPKWIEAEIRRLDDFSVELFPICHRLNEVDKSSVEGQLELVTMARSKLIVIYNRFYVAEFKEIDDQFTEEVFTVKLVQDDSASGELSLKFYSKSIFMPFGLEDVESSESSFSSSDFNSPFPEESQGSPKITLKACAE